MSAPTVSPTLAPPVADARRSGWLAAFALAAVVPALPSATCYARAAAADRPTGTGRAQRNRRLLVAMSLAYAAPPFATIMG